MPSTFRLVPIAISQFIEFSILVENSACLLETCSQNEFPIRNLGGFCGFDTNTSL